MAKSELMKFGRKFLPLLIFLAGMLPIIFHLNTVGLFETSEGRYASVARQMLDSGDWLTPCLNGLKHFTKPPVTYWLSALGMKAFGINEFGARFFLSVAAGLTTLGTFYIGQLFFGTLSGVIAAMTLCTSLFFQAQFRGLTTDPFLAAAETLMVLTFFFYLNNPRRPWAIVFWLMTALGFMVKGPPALLPLTGLIPAAFFTGQKPSIVKLFKSFAGWALFFIFGLGWYLLMALKNPGLLSYFLVDETLNRVASNAHQRSAPFYYFFVLLPIGMFPWVSFFFASLKEKIKEFRSDPAATYLLLWVTVPLLIFSLSRSKLASYALPLMVPVALLTAEAIRKIFFTQDQESSTSARWHSTVVAALTSIIGMGLSVWGYNNFNKVKIIAQTAIFGGIFWLFSSLMLLLFIVKNNRKGMFCIISMIVPGLMFFILPAIKGNEPYREGKFLTSQWLLLKRVATLSDTQKLICVDQMIEGWYFYTGRVVKTFNISRVTQFDKDRASELVLNDVEAFKSELDPDTYLVLPAKAIPQIEAISGMELQIVTGEGNWKIAVPLRKTGG